MDMSAELSERGSLKAKAAIIILFLILAAFLYGIVMESMKKNIWLKEQCNINFLMQFREGAQSLEEAERLAGSLLTVDELNESGFQYCSGYAIISGGEHYFLCSDGRLYGLISCSEVEQGDNPIPVLPSPSESVW